MRVPWISALLACTALLAGASAMQAQGTSRAYLGISFRDISPERAESLHLADGRGGVEVVGVRENSPAAKAGLKDSDVLLMLDGEPIPGARQFGSRLVEMPPGRKIKLQVWREGKTHATEAVLSAAPRSLDMSGDWAAIPSLPFHGLTTTAYPRMLMVWIDPLLGVECEPLDSQLAQYFGVRSGVLVRQVGQDSAADKAGMHAGDVITAIGSRNITAPHDLISYLRNQQQPITSVIVELVRDRKPRTITIPLTD